MNKDWQLIVKSAIIVVVATVWMTGLVSVLPTAPEARYAFLIVGNVLLLIVFAVEVIAIDLVRYGSRQALQLTPQTQLALWIVGLLAILLATDGLQWLKPDVNFWLFLPIALTVALWPGLMWLQERLTVRRTGKGQGPPSGGPTTPSTRTQNSVYALWLLLAGMAIVALEALVPSRNRAGQLIEIAFALALIYLAVAEKTEARPRAVLLVTGVALAIPPLMTALQLVSNTPLVNGDVERYVLWIRSAILGAATVYFGFAASQDLVPRLLVAALGIAWAAFITLGPPNVTDPTIVLQILLVPFIIWCYWAAARLESGKPKDTRT